jgi:hypothetical protein
VYLTSLTMLRRTSPLPSGAPSDGLALHGGTFAAFDAEVVR